MCEVSKRLERQAKVWAIYHNSLKFNAHYVTKQKEANV
jgi:hypothetical protein